MSLCAFINLVSPQHNATADDKAATLFSIFLSACYIALILSVLYLIYKYWSYNGVEKDKRFYTLINDLNLTQRISLVQPVVFLGTRFIIAILLLFSSTGVTKVGFFHVLTLLVTIYSLLRPFHGQERNRREILPNFFVLSITYFTIVFAYPTLNYSFVYKTGYFMIAYFFTTILVSFIIILRQLYVFMKINGRK